MDQHQPEVEDARLRARKHGFDPQDFDFEVEYLPPDPDGGGMYTVRYVVTIEHAKSGNGMSAIGGIGLDWVGEFEAELRAGYFA